MSSAPPQGFSRSQATTSLAILGADPAFPDKRHVGRPNLGNRSRFLARVHAMLDSNWLTNDGPLVREFEREIRHRLGVKHCVATCNGTMALMLTIRALGLKGEIIVPSFTFIATAHAIRWLGINPVFCDVDPLTHNIDPEEAERLITPKTSAIMGVHLWGRPCKTSELDAVAAKHGIKSVYDASHAFGVSHQGRSIGKFGQAEVFSFHATKFVHTFEGGAVVTEDDRLARKLRLMRNYGFSGADTVSLLGTNAKMSEICAAMGMTNLEETEAFIAVNRRNDHIYRKESADLPGITFFDYDEGEEANYQFAICEVNGEACPLNRDELIAVLHAEGVLARRYFFPGCHRMEPYASETHRSAAPLPHTDRLAAEVLALPTGTSTRPDDVRKIVAILRSALAQPSNVRNALHSEG